MISLNKQNLLSTSALWIVLFSLFFVTRLVNYKIIPIFTDEAIYSYWAQVALHDPANRYISLVDGKQPLFIWLAAISQKFIADPLVATRLVSTISGFFAVIGIFLLTREIFDKKVAFLSSFLYIVLPFTLLYDRMALYDSLLTLFGIWSVYLSIKLAKKPALDIAILNGVVLGLGLLTKSSAAFYISYIPFSLLFFNFKKTKRLQNLLKWFFFVLISVSISEVMFNSLRLSPLFYIIGLKNYEFIRPFSQVIENPLLFFYPNMNAIFGWSASYISAPLFSLLLLGAMYYIYKKNLKVLYLTILIAVPLLFEALFNKVLYPRFVLFYFSYAIIIIAYSIRNLHNNIKNYKIFVAIALTFLFILPITKSFNLITNPVYADIPDADAGQYLNDWPAGYGVQEVISILKGDSMSQQVSIGTEGTFGLFPFALNIYFYSNNKVHIYSYWPVDGDRLPQQIMDISKTQKTYFVFNANQNPITNPHLKFIGEYKKGVGNSYMRLYEII